MGTTPAPLRDRVRRRFEQAEQAAAAPSPSSAVAVSPEPESEPEPPVARPSHHRLKRPYRKSGLYRFVLDPGDQAVIDGVRDALVADCGGADNISMARRLLIDLAAAAAIRCQRVNAYLATLPSLVDRQHREEWRVVGDARRAEAHLQSLLRDIGLDRAPVTVTDIRRQCGID